MATVNNNKESFELLRGSPDSDSGSDVSEIVFPVRKKRFRRRLKNNPSIQHEETGNECQCRARTISLTLFCIVLICWLVTLTWLAVVLHSEINRLTSHMSQVVAGIQGVPDALQKCHTLSKDLQKNQTQIMSRLTGFAALLTNFSLELSDVKSGLQTVQDQLKSSPDLVNNPRLVEDLSASVASFGSQIRDLNTTVSTLKDQNGKLDGMIGNLVNNVSEVKGNVTELSKAYAEKGGFPEWNFAAEKEAILAAVNQASRNLSAVNETLSSRLQWTIEEQSKDHKLVESLQEMNENVTTRVRTLESLCAKRPPPLLLSGNYSNDSTDSSKSNPGSVTFATPSPNIPRQIVDDSKSGSRKHTQEPKTLANPPPP